MVRGAWGLRWWSVLCIARSSFIFRWVLTGVIRSSETLIFKAGFINYGHVTEPLLPHTVLLHVTEGSTTASKPATRQRQLRIEYVREVNIDLNTNAYVWFPARLSSVVISIFTVNVWHVSHHCCAQELHAVKQSQACNFRLIVFQHMWSSSA